VLELVVEYMIHHAGTEPDIVEKPLRSKNMKDVVKDQWDATFIDNLALEKQKLYDVILAANYMDIRSLLHLGCAKVASLIKGQPLDKIKGILNPKAQDQPEADEKKE
jgi:S-phase kinase-associated protein 1